MESHICSPFQFYAYRFWTCRKEHDRLQNRDQRQHAENFRGQRPIQSGKCCRSIVSGVTRLGASAAACTPEVEDNVAIDVLIHTRAMISTDPRGPRERAARDARGTRTEHRHILIVCRPTAPALPIEERRLRNVAVFQAALGQENACLYLFIWRAVGQNTRAADAGIDTSNGRSRGPSYERRPPFVIRSPCINEIGA